MNKTEKKSLKLLNELDKLNNKYSFSLSVFFHIFMNIFSLNNFFRLQNIKKLFILLLIPFMTATYGVAQDDDDDDDDGFDNLKTRQINTQALEAGRRFCADLEAGSVYHRACMKNVLRGAGYGNMSSWGDDCVGCAHSRSSGGILTTLIEAAGKSVAPIANYFGRREEARAQRKIAEYWSNSQKEIHQTWADAYSDGFDSCNSRFSTALNYTIEYGTAPIRDELMQSFCNDVHAGQFPGYAGLFADGYGGFGNGFLGAGYSSGFLSGMRGPYGFMDMNSLYGQNYMYGNGMGVPIGGGGFPGSSGLGLSDILGLLGGGGPGGGGGGLPTGVFTGGYGVPNGTSFGGPYIFGGGGHGCCMGGSPIGAFGHPGGYFPGGVGGGGFVGPGGPGFGSGVGFPGGGLIGGNPIGSGIITGAYHGGVPGTSGGFGGPFGGGGGFGFPGGGLIGGNPAGGFIGTGGYPGGGFIGGGVGGYPGGGTYPGAGGASGGVVGGFPGSGGGFGGGAGGGFVGGGLTTANTNNFGYGYGPVIGGAPYFSGDTPVNTFASGGVQTQASVNAGLVPQYNAQGSYVNSSSSSVGNSPYSPSNLGFQF